MDAVLTTAQLQACLDRIERGDHRALNELLIHAQTRLKVLARQMLRSFPSVDRWVEVDDVLQNALVRLARALNESQRPASVREFFGLAAIQLRRELLDLARYYRRRENAGLTPNAKVTDIHQEADSSSELECWLAFHEAVETLPDELREVVALRFYHGRPVSEIAEMLKIAERTVIRRWQATLWILTEKCGLIEG